MEKPVDVFIRALRKVPRFLYKGVRIEAPSHFTGCEDATDNKFFDCAIAGHADYIIGHDSHQSGAGIS